MIYNNIGIVNLQFHRDQIAVLTAAVLRARAIMLT
jgi:hypothetical protein